MTSHPRDAQLGQVTIASRAMAEAGTGEIVVTAPVVGAVAGQAVAFEPLGAHDLKGVPGTWELFRLQPKV